MSEAKDPTIMLFGKSIPFQELLYNNPEQDRPCPDSVLDDAEEKETEKDTLGGKPTEAKLEAEAQPLSVKETMSGVSENPKTPSVEETGSVKMFEEELSETSVSQDKTLKKPDKIIPCPRCNSMDTKFCYYNNYNVNQARHLCRSCQRYWTAGGTMRNVPVGAGRRKSKNSASHCHHIAISEAQPGIPNGLHHPSLQTNGNVLTFGSCESMAEKTVLKGFHRHEDAKILVSDITLENGDDRLNGSSKVDADINESVESVMNSQGCYPQTPCFPSAPWPYQWSSPVHPPFFFPMPFYPTVPYWFLQPPFPVQTPQTAGPNSPTLGKHSREENESMLKSSNSDKDENCEENNSKRCLWIPKTLRIDDPGEAAKSSIWATLGIKYDEADSISGEGLFRAFRSKLNGKSDMVETSPVLHANPAALSRSLNFQESS